MRLVLNSAFDQDLELLEDRSYFAHRGGYFRHVDVTERAETCSRGFDGRPVYTDRPIDPEQAFEDLL